MHEDGLIKVCQFDSQTERDVFAEAIHFSRGGRAGLEKIANKGTELRPEVAAFIKALKPDPQFQYVLMTPMGSFEHWGANVNGDAFPKVSLAFDRDSGNWLAVAKALAAQWLTPHGKEMPTGQWPNFGYKTFLEADRYRHHINKDRNLSYGDIVLAMWNDVMHRVEVLVRHDWEKAKKVGAEDILKDLDEGKPRQISMGCRVPFDVCTVCGNIAKRPANYCVHLKTMMGQVMPDGRVVAAVNFFPRFFDLSDVIVPAAKESAVLMKVAGQGTVIPGAYLGEAIYGGNKMSKVASAKVADEKKAAIDKKVISNSALSDAVAHASAREPEINVSALTRIANLDKLLATLTGCGIVLKKREFQRAALDKMGHVDKADLLDKHNLVFKTAESAQVLHIDEADFDGELAEKIAGLLPSRSSFYPHFPKRLVTSAVSDAPVRREPVEVEQNNELLEKVAEAYSAYRRGVGRSGQFLVQTVETYFDFFADHFFEDAIDAELTKTASGFDFDASESVTSLYMHRAHGVTVEGVNVSSYLGITSTRSAARELLGLPA